MGEAVFFGKMGRCAARPFTAFARLCQGGWRTLRRNWSGFPLSSRIVLVALFALALVPHLFQVAYMVGRGFYAGAVLAQVGMAMLVVLVPFLFLSLRGWLMVEGLVLLLFPLELTSWLTLREPLSYSVYSAVRHTTSHEALGQLTAFMLPALLFVVLMHVYFVLLFRFVPRGCTLRWRQRGVGILIFAILFVLMPLVAIRPKLSGDVLLYWAYHYREERAHLSMGTYPLDVALHTVRYQREQREAEAVFARRGHPPVDDLSRDTDSVPTVGVLVIGETSRACNWSLAGYGRDTNPRLSQRDDVHFFTDAYSGANNTLSSVPMLLSQSTPEDKDRWMRDAFVTEVLAAGGYRVAWVTLQGEGEVWLSTLLESCASKTVITSTFFDGSPMDGVLLPHVATFLDTVRGNALLILHTMGGHFQYTDRYSPSEAHFTPGLPRDYKLWSRMLHPSMRGELLNSFDNTVRYTDWVLDSVISSLRASGRPSFMLYVADHGENLYDTPDVGTFHASANPSHYEAHVPYLVWLSPEYRQMYPAREEALRAHRGRRIQSTCTFHTLLDLAGVRYAGFDARKSLVDTAFREPERRPVLSSGGEVVQEPPYPTDGTCPCGMHRGAAGCRRAE